MNSINSCCSNHSSFFNILVFHLCENSKSTFNNSMTHLPECLKLARLTILNVCEEDFLIKPNNLSSYPAISFRVTFPKTKSICTLELNQNNVSGSGGGTQLEDLHRLTSRLNIKL